MGCSQDSQLAALLCTDTQQRAHLNLQCIMRVIRGIFNDLFYYHSSTRNASWGILSAAIKYDIYIKKKLEVPLKVLKMQILYFPLTQNFGWLWCELLGFRGFTCQGVCLLSSIMEQDCISVTLSAKKKVEKPWEKNSTALSPSRNHDLFYSR